MTCVKYKIRWFELPSKLRNKFCKEFIFDKTDHGSGNLKYFREELAKFNCEYTSNNEVIFENEAYYTWFIMRWS